MGTAGRRLVGVGAPGPFRPDDRGIRLRFNLRLVAPVGVGPLRASPPPAPNNRG